MAATYVYEIRVVGTVPPELLLDFDHGRASMEPAGTVVHGWLPDHAALSALLARLEMHGIELLAMRHFRGGPRAPVEAAGGSPRASQGLAIPAGSRKSASRS
jgi:hypothetical protein